MLEINLHVTPHLLQTLVSLIKVVVQSFQQGLAVEVEPVDDDADLASSLLFPAGSTFALPRPAPWRLRERAS